MQAKQEKIESLEGGFGRISSAGGGEQGTDSRTMAAHPTIKSWPDLVGLNVEEAKKKILEEHPNMLVQIVPEGSFVTMDFNLRRVRIHKTKEEKVAQIPKQG